MRRARYIQMHVILAHVTFQDFNFKFSAYFSRQITNPVPASVSTKGTVMVIQMIATSHAVNIAENAITDSFERSRWPEISTIASPIATHLRYCRCKRER